MKKETEKKVIETTPENANGEIKATASYEVDISPDGDTVADLLEYVGAKKLSAGELQENISLRLEKLAFKISAAANRKDVNGDSDGTLSRNMVEFVLHEIQALELTVSTKRARY